MKSQFPDLPTITACQGSRFGFFNDHKPEYVLGENLTISYFDGFNWLNFTSAETKFNKNTSERVTVEYMITAHSCFKINAISSHIKGNVRGIKLIYYESTPKEDLPGNFEFYVTSEQNSYSALFGQFMNGNVIRHLTYLGDNVRFGIKSEKFVYLKEKSGCVDKSFWELWEPFYHNHENLKNCSEKCSAITLPNNR